MGLLGCKSKATEAQCDRAYNQLVQIRTATDTKIMGKVKASELEKARSAFLKECVGKTQSAVIECWLASKTKADLLACEKK